MKRPLPLLLVLALVAACASDAVPDDERPALGDGGLGDAQVEARADASGVDARTRTIDASGSSGGDASSTRPQDAARDAQSTRDAASASAADATTGAPLSGASSGCGKAVADAAGKFTMHTVRSGDANRTFQVYVPEGYQPTRRYPAIFRFHGTGGDGLSGGLDVQNVAPKDVLIISPDGTLTRNEERTWTASTAEIDLFDALVAAVGERYCVDLGHVFAYGFSAGAGFAETLACVRGNTLRGVAAIAGYEWTRGRACEGHAAAWLLHDGSDPAAPVAGGRAARDRLLQQNGCSMATEPAGTSCVRYRGCVDGHPVVWCETQGMGHNIRGDYAPGEVWKFFSGLP